MVRLLALLLAYLFLGLALIGVVLPGVPTVPFLLLAAWFSARGSERLNRWLYSHPTLGKMLIDWEEHGAVSRRNKSLAVVMLCISWTILYFRDGRLWLMLMITVLFITVSTFLLTRPEPEDDLG